MILSILQGSRDRERLTWKDDSLTAARVKDHSTAMIYFG